MRLLLDTQVLLWWLADDPELSDEARAAIGDPGSWVAVSAASAWEIAIKAALGKLDAPDELEAALEDGGLTPLPVTVAHALAAGRLPPLHADPFDRMLVAQAIDEGLTVVTRDPWVSRYSVAVIAA